MKIWFVSRHPGAQAWANKHRLIDGDTQLINHLDVDDVGTGDVVVGDLPIQLIDILCQRGVRYFQLVLDLPESARGQHLTADDMDLYGARLVEFKAQRTHGESTEWRPDMGIAPPWRGNST